jgi:hypothetical protein
MVIAHEYVVQVEFPVNDDPAGMLEDNDAGISAGPHAAAGKARHDTYITAFKIHLLFSHALLLRCWLML